MKMQRLIGFVVLVLAGFAAYKAGAQTIMCGSSACGNAFMAAEQGGSYGVITGIDGLSVDGNTFNVAFTASQQVGTMYYDTVAGVLPLPNNPNFPNGFDAGLAIEAALGGVRVTDPTLAGAGMYVSVNGVQTWVQGIQSATSALSMDGQSYYSNGVQTFVGTNIAAVSAQQVMATSIGCGGMACTTWTQVASAPELEPGSLAGALTLLAGLIAVRRRA